MWTAYATGLIALTLVLVAWVAVQRAWKKVVSGAEEDPDALAGRLGCHGTCSSEPCPPSCPGRPPAEEEEP